MNRRKALKLGGWGLAAAAAAAVGGCAVPRSGDDLARFDVLGDDSIPRPPFDFDSADSVMLDGIQRGCFNFLWNECGATGMVRDRTGVPFASVAGVGFQLSAIPAAVERGFITRHEGAARARLILAGLRASRRARVNGMFYHYLDADTGEPALAGPEVVASTIDSAILFAGLITLSSAFGGDIGERADALVDEAQWAAYLRDDDMPAHERGFISLGWKPEHRTRPDGPGKLLPFVWMDAGDEQRLVSFIAAGSPREHRVGRDVHDRLRRVVGTDDGDPAFVWFPWSGALFTHFFAHCWIDYAHVGADAPAHPRRPRVDWWENARRAVRMHHRRAAANTRRLPTFGTDAWGLGASDAASGYVVTQTFPTPLPIPGARRDVDDACITPEDNWGDGTVAPYNAGCAIMFEPEPALRALRHYRSLDGTAGRLSLWRDPRAGGYGFLDSFNAGTGWVAPDCVAIDQGPLFLALENARTGRIWSLFGSHRHAAAASDELWFPRPRVVKRS